MFSTRSHAGLELTVDRRTGDAPTYQRPRIWMGGPTNIAASCFVVDMSGKSVLAFDQAVASADTLKRIFWPRLSSEAMPFFQASSMVPFIASSLHARHTAHACHV